MFFCAGLSFTLLWNAEKPACRISQTHRAFCLTAEKSQTKAALMHELAKCCTLLNIHAQAAALYLDREIDFYFTFQLVMPEIN